MITIEGSITRMSCQQKQEDFVLLKLSLNRHQFVKYIATLEGGTHIYIIYVSVYNKRRL